MQLPHINPYARAIKKYIIEIVGDEYTAELDEVADRIAHNLATEKDAEGIIHLLSKVFGAGYKRAIDSVDEAMAKRGLKIKISPPKKMFG
jgi:hypothetical protein